MDGGWNRFYVGGGLGLAGVTLLNDRNAGVMTGLRVGTKNVPTLR